MSAISECKPRVPVSAMLTVLLLNVGMAVAQQRGAEFEEGQLQLCREPMRELIRLQFDGSGLALRQDWDDGAAEESSKEARDLDREIPDPADPIEELIRREIGIDVAREARLRMLDQIGSSGGLANRFFALAEASGSNTRGRTMIGNMVNLRFSGRNLEGSAESKTGGLEIRFRELAAPKRRIEIHDPSDGSFLFRFSGGNFEILLKQKSDGQILLQRSNGTTDEKIEATSFAEFRSLHRGLTDQWLFPLFDHLGFALPLTPEDPAIVSAVVKRLAAVSEFSLDDLKIQINNLDSDDFHVRERASNFLAEHLRLFDHELAAALDNESISLESRIRLERLMSRPTPTTQIERLITNQKLLNSESYLIGILSQIEPDQQRHVIARLKQISEKDFDRAEQWANWGKR